MDPRTDSSTQLSIAALRPYTSIILASLPEPPDPSGAVDEVLSDIEKALAFRADGPRRLVSRSDPTDEGDLTVGFLHYREDRAPSWTTDPAVVDLLNQLVLVGLRGRHVAIFLSDRARAPAIASKLKKKGVSGLGALSPIEPGVLNAAFAMGPARTLWLSGVHGRTTLKADAKILTGGNLRDALDPLGDQTYYFTAARCVTSLGARRVPVGVSPRRSRVWTGATRRWEEFRDGVSTLLEAVEVIADAHRSVDAPIEVLAVADPMASVTGAFDASLVSPDTLSEESVDQDTRDMLERWVSLGNFEVEGKGEGGDFTMRLSFDGRDLGAMDFAVDLTDPPRVRWQITPHPATEGDERFDEALQLCKSRRWLEIRYESGATVSDGTVYAVRYRDVRFSNWDFVDLSGYDISKEKPDKPAKKSSKKAFDRDAIGASDSLFCWVWNNWPDLSGGRQLRGWLACDDGPMEFADFIHFDEASSPPVLSLIHVKGAHGSGISVSDYEVVTGQAVKNLRYLDDLILAQGLKMGMRKAVGSIVWHNGAKEGDRGGMIEVIDRAGSNYRRRVVVLQPRVSRADRDQARKALDRNTHSSAPAAARLRQLETLLVGADAACRALSADLLVIGNGTATPKARK